jgi:hypothetical protein
MMWRKIAVALAISTILVGLTLFAMRVWIDSL